MRIDRATAGRLFTAGMDGFVNAHPVIAPSAFPAMRSRLSGEDENRSMIASFSPGVDGRAEHFDHAVVAQALVLLVPPQPLDVTVERVLTEGADDEPRLPRGRQ